MNWWRPTSNFTCGCQKYVSESTILQKVRIFLIIRKCSSKYDTIHLIKFENNSITQIMKDCKGVGDITTNTMDAGTHDLHGCGVNNSFKGVKVQESEIHTIEHHVC